MKKLLLLVPLWIGVLVAKQEALVTSSQSECAYSISDPRKNYRAKMAQQYFGKGKCRKWNRFCGR